MGFGWLPALIDSPDVSPDNLACNKVNSIFLSLNLDKRFHFTVPQHSTFRLHASNRTYFGEISFLNLAQQTSSKFILKFLDTLILM